jgi:hypothetical protein
MTVPSPTKGISTAWGLYNPIACVEFLSIALAHASTPVLWVTKEIIFPQGSYAAKASPWKQLVWQARENALSTAPNSYKLTV